MKLINCPVNGMRSISEFVYGGEYRQMPDPSKVNDATWADYIFNRDNAPGIKKEWWCHLPSTTWFIVERNTLTDEIIRTYLADELVLDELVGVEA